MTQTRVYRPTPVPKDLSESELSPRLASFDGSRLGLLWNSKVNADIYLSRLQELLLERHSNVDIVWRTKESSSKPMAADDVEALSACDAVVTAFGD